MTSNKTETRQRRKQYWFTHRANKNGDLKKPKFSMLCCSINSKWVRPAKLEIHRSNCLQKCGLCLFRHIPTYNRLPFPSYCFIHLHLTGAKRHILI